MPTRGVDSNNLDGIAFVDPRQGFIEIIQAIGELCELAKKPAKSMELFWYQFL